MRKTVTVMVAAMMLWALPATAQKPGQTATQFYNDYRTAWAQSTSMDTLLPYVSKEGLAQYQATPREQQQTMFQTMKEMGAMTNVTVVKETKTADGYLLELSAVAPQNRTATGTAQIVVEDGAMKLKKESWSL